MLLPASDCPEQLCAKYFAEACMQEIDSPSPHGLVVWFTGLSCSGKSTIASAVLQCLRSRRIRAELLDGDDIRRTLSKDLGFSRKDRDENVRRLGFLAALLSRLGINVLVAAVSPSRESRAKVRQQCEKFIEVYVNAPLSVCEARDTRGIYSRARRHELTDMTGIDHEYESPDNPDIECCTAQETVMQSVERVLHVIEGSLQISRL